jgi:hypothetical protein
MPAESPGPAPGGAFLLIEPHLFDIALNLSRQCRVSIPEEFADSSLTAGNSNIVLPRPVAQREPQIKPDRVLDDWRREAMSAVGELIHAGSLPYRATRSNPVSVTLPFGQLHPSLI